MLMVNIFEVKAKLSEYLDRAAEGERILICRHNKPVAELRAVEAAPTEPRPVGPLPGRPAFDVPRSFFDPLPDEDLDLWHGGTDLFSPVSSKSSADTSKGKATKKRNRLRPAHRTRRRHR